MPPNNYQKFHHVRPDTPVDMMPFEELRRVPSADDHGISSPMNTPKTSPRSQSPKDFIEGTNTL